MSATADENLELMRAVLAGMRTGSWESIAPRIGADASLTIHGESGVSGTYHGRDAYVGGLRKLRTLTAGAFDVQPITMMANDDWCLQFVRITGKRPDGRELDTYEVILYRARNGQAIEGHFIPADQRAFDAFLEGQA